MKPRLVYIKHINQIMVKYDKQMFLSKVKAVDYMKAINSIFSKYKKIDICDVVNDKIESEIKEVLEEYRKSGVLLYEHEVVNSGEYIPL